MTKIGEGSASLRQQGSSSNYTEEERTSNGGGNLNQKEENTKQSWTDGLRATENRLTEDGKGGGPVATYWGNERG